MPFLSVRLFTHVVLGELHPDSALDEEDRLGVQVIRGLKRCYQMPGSSDIDEQAPHIFVVYKLMK